MNAAPRAGFEFDLAIVGLGVHGSAIAAATARRGLRVVGFEQSSRCEVSGASAGPRRMLRVSDPNRPELGKLSREARDRWHELSLGLPKPLIRDVSAVGIGPLYGSGKVIDGRSHPIAGDDIRLASLAPEVRARGAVVDPDCALLDAKAAVGALRTEAIRAGAELHFDQRVEAALTPHRWDTLWIGGQNVHAGFTLFCVGARVVDLPEWARPVGVRTEPAYMQVGRLSEPRLAGLDTEYFYLFDNDSNPFCLILYADDVGDALQFGHFSAPRSGGSRSPEAPNSESYAEMVAGRDVTTLRNVFPGLGKLLDRTTVVGAYTFTSGNEFALHRASEFAATLVACAAIGFKYAPALAERVAAIVKEWMNNERNPRAG